MRDAANDNESFGTAKTASSGTALAMINLSAALCDIYAICSRISNSNRQGNPRSA